MGCWGPDQPNKLDYAQQTRDTLQAQLDLAPQLFAAEKQYEPQRAQLQADIAQQLLPQVLDMYKQASLAGSEVDNAAQTARVANEMGMVQQYAPQIAQTLRDASGNTALLQALNSQAMAGLNGDMIDPQLAAQIAQSARAAQAGRGMMTSGAPAVNAEALMGAERAIANRNANRQFAGNVVGLNQATGGDPFLSLLGRPSGASVASGLMGQASGYNPGQIFNPESAYAGNIYASNNAYDWQYKQATPSTMGKVGMVSDTIGSFVGSVAKGFMCSIAREAFGVWDPRWILFRRWLLTRAPRWFRSWYADNQLTVALWLRDRAWARVAVRGLMNVVLKVRCA